MEGGGKPFDTYNMAAAAAAQERLVPPGVDLGPAAADIETALRIDPVRYTGMMRAYALHLGAAERAGTPVDVQLRAEDGFISGLRLDNGSTVPGHLFIDCTGPAATIRSRLDSDFDDWSRWLPCDRILLAEAPTATEPPPLDQAVAMAAGWRWECVGARRTSYGYTYSSAYLDDASARHGLHAATGAEPLDEAVRVRQGCRPQPWLRNCVAIGDAACSVEPLEWANLHIAHSAIDRIISMMPDRSCAAVELWDYNRQSAAEAERIRDFLVLHYVTARRPGDPFWRDVSGTEPPASLRSTLDQFGERGRLPFFEEETFSRDSWLAVLLGQQVMPRRVDPLVDAVPPTQAAQAMARLEQATEAAIPQLPSQGAYLEHLLRQSAR
jgi:tryptophan halogenase